jgi:uncharacterized membrane protein YphA (DoxX/SURF4 family)
VSSLGRRLARIDVAVTRRMAKYGITAVRISLGIVFFWFGFLKFFPGLSPAQELAAKTIRVLTFGFASPEVSLPILAAGECLIGIGLVVGKFLRAVLLLLFIQMLGTITPLVLFPGDVFQRAPYAPNLEGQYIIKNIVLISAALVVGATVRGGRLSAEPKR